ncbi:hypothetical protein [Actinomadura atramentaria]|uniref:hypothetical protein n=1 Tax=Actinomadura atramentaria TaxID=1990 RepID=UPI000399A6F1|nr:hypothetical protein [Actinomadura atramentaria]
MSGTQGNDSQEPFRASFTWRFLVDAVVANYVVPLALTWLLQRLGVGSKRGIGITAVLCVLVTLAATGGLWALFAVRPEAAGRMMRAVLAWLTRVTRAAAWTALGAAASALVLLAVAGVHRVVESFEPCGSPLELRVLAAPEALTPLRAAAAEFVRDAHEPGRSRCPRYAVSVAAEPDVLALPAAFADDRAASDADTGSVPGPQPDIWIPSSFSEYAYADPDPPGDDRRLEVLGSLGRSPVVIALFTKDDNLVYSETSTPREKTAEEILVRFKGYFDLTGIARPIPESFAPSLLATPALYAALVKSGTIPRSADAERFLSPVGSLAPDPATLLCGLRAEALRGADPPGGLAVAVPEQAVLDYDAGRALGDRCEAAGRDPIPADWRLHPYYADDLPLLNYPFVRVRRPGQDTAARAAGVGAFRSWLDDHPLTSQGLRDTSCRHRPDAAAPDLARAAGRDTGGLACPAPPKSTRAARDDFQSALETFNKARQRVALSVVLDVSGSMGYPASTATRGSRLSVGVEFLRGLNGQLKGDDTASLWTFAQPSRSRPRDPVATPVGSAPLSAGDQRADLAAALARQEPAGRDFPLARALARVDDQPKAGDVLVVTDGQGPRSATDADLDALAAFHRAHPGTGITLALTGPTRCDFAPVRRIRDRVDAGCVRLSGDDAGQAARLLVQWRDPARGGKR